jgi:hypothetical protein
LQHPRPRSRRCLIARPDPAALSGRKDRAFFEAVRIDDEAGAIAWEEEIALCPDALYLRLTGKVPEEIFPDPRPARADA